MSQESGNFAADEEAMRQMASAAQPTPTTQIDDTQSSATDSQPPPPVYEHPSYGFTFPDALARRRLLSDACVEAVVDARKAARTHPDRIVAPLAFQGMMSMDEVQATVKAWLDEIWTDERSHIEVAADLDVDSRTMHPTAWCEAISRISAVQGWSAECYSTLLESNSGFMEHHATTLTHLEDVEHRVSPNIAVAIGLPASSRKSGLLEHCDGLMLNMDGLPKSMGRAVLVTEATKKGIESMLFSQKRALVSSAEACCTVEIPGFSDTKSGVHFVSKQRLCTWTQAEASGTAIAGGTTPLPANGYSFGTRLLGQRETIETFLVPTPQAPLGSIYFCLFLVPELSKVLPGFFSLPQGSASALTFASYPTPSWQTQLPKASAAPPASPSSKTGINGWQKTSSLRQQM